MQLCPVDSSGSCVVVCMSPSVNHGNLLGGFLEAASFRKGEAHSVLRETWLLLWGARACLISRVAPFTEAFKQKTEKQGHTSHDLM